MNFKCLAIHKTSEVRMFFTINIILPLIEVHFALRLYFTLLWKMDKRDLRFRSPLIIVLAGLMLLTSCNNRTEKHSSAFSVETSSRSYKQLTVIQVSDSLVVLPAMGNSVKIGRPNVVPNTSICPIRIGVPNVALVPTQLPTFTPKEVAMGEPKAETLLKSGDVPYLQHGKGSEFIFELPNH